MSLKGIILPIILIIGVLGSIFGGLATPTEAAAIGAFGAVICTIVYSRFSWGMIKDACYRTTKLIGMILWIMVGISCFNCFFMGMGGAHLIEGLIAGASPWVVLIGMMLSLFILGMFMDDYAIIMIATPIYMPVVVSLGFDPLWFGMIFLVNIQIAILSPPFGPALFYLRGCVDDKVGYKGVSMSAFPYMGMQVIGLTLCILFPQIVLWLPNLIFGLSRCNL